MNNLFCIRMKVKRLKRTIIIGIKNPKTKNTVRHISRAKPCCQFNRIGLAIAMKTRIRGHRIVLERILIVCLNRLKRAKPDQF